MKEQLFPMRVPGPLGLEDSPGRRAAAYWFMDGLPEIVAGLGFAILGAGGVWYGSIHPHSWLVRIVFLTLELAVVAAVFGYNRSITLSLKSRLTFPRTGYVRPPVESATRRHVVLSLGLADDRKSLDQNLTDFNSATLGVVVIGNVLTGLIEHPAGLPIAMCVIAALFYYRHRGSERPYHWASVLPLPVAGLGAMTLGMGHDANAWTAEIIGGAWLAAQGGWNLARYLRQNPKPAAAEILR